jgi:hypothetical protein
MTTFKIQAGATIETTSPDELRGILKEHDGFLAELARGVKPMRFSAAGTVSGGAVTIPQNQSGQLKIGPSPGFLWVVQRVSAFGLAAETSSVANSGNSISAQGQVADPSTNTIIASAPASDFTGGAQYSVTGSVYLDGTVTSADDDNMKLVANGVILAKLNVAFNGGAGGVMAPFGPVVFTAAATPTALSIEAAAAASGADADYHAQLTATPVAAAISGVASAEGDILQVHRTESDGSALIGTLSYSEPWLHIGKGGIILYGGESLLVTGSGLTATGQILVNGEGIEVPAFMLAKLLT